MTDFLVDVLVFLGLLLFYQQGRPGSHLGSLMISFIFHVAGLDSAVQLW